MLLFSLCWHTPALAHSSPSLYWWLSLNAEEQGTWAAAIGSFLAVVIAIFLSTRDIKKRDRQRTADARALASYLRTEVTTIFFKIPSLLIYLEGLRDGRIGQSPSELDWLRSTVDEICDSQVLEHKVDRFGVLPDNIGEQLAAATGSLQRARKAVWYVADNITYGCPS